MSCHHVAVRVLHLVGRSHLRGAERVALELAEELDRRGHQNRMCAVGAGHEGELDVRLPALTGDARHRPATLARAARALRRQLRHDPVDVILGHGAAATLVAVMAAPRRGPAIVFQTILGLAEQSFGLVYGTAWRVAARRIDGVVALTPAYGEEMRHFGYRGPIWPLPNARRSDRFDAIDHRSVRANLRAELGLAPGQPLIGLVGYLVEQKCPQRAVEVLAQLRQTHPDAHLVVVGSGPLASAVEERAGELGVAPSLTMLGHRDDVAGVLGALDVLILTSDDEGVPGVLVEAAMAGCPAVTFPLGGVADVVLDGVTGVVLAERTVDAMTTAVAHLLQDPDLRHAMTTAAQTHGATFSMAAVAPRYEAALQEMTTV